MKLIILTLLTSKDQVKIVVKNFVRYKHFVIFFEKFKVVFKPQHDS